VVTKVGSGQNLRALLAGMFPLRSIVPMFILAVFSSAIFEISPPPLRTHKFLWNHLNLNGLVSPQAGWEGCCQNVREKCTVGSSRDRSDTSLGSNPRKVAILWLGHTDSLVNFRLKLGPEDWTEGPVS